MFVVYKKKSRNFTKLLTFLSKNFRKLSCQYFLNRRGLTFERFYQKRSCLEKKESEIRIRHYKYHLSITGSLGKQKRFERHCVRKKRCMVDKPPFKNKRRLFSHSKYC